jgi:hypothetical protein
MGQQRRFDPAPTMSGLPLTADIAVNIGKVAKGHKATWPVFRGFFTALGERL